MASQKYKAELEKQQEVLMNIADIIMETFAMESSLLRSRKHSAKGQGANAADMTTVYLRDAMARIEISARNVLGACVNGPALSRAMAMLQRFAKYDPVDAIGLRRKIAARLLDAERYIV
jgi:hypothetical protein